MMQRIAPLVATAIVLSALDASAQDPDVFPPAPAPVTTPQCGELLRPADLLLYADAMAMANRRAREVDRLYAVMSREGNEFSQEKYEAYRNRRIGGGLLIALGASSMFAAMVSGITLATTSGSSDDYDEYSDEYEEDTRSSLLPGLPLGLLFSGIGAIAIGVPLVISGGRGKRRQEVLYRKDEILAPYARPDAAVSFFADPERGAGGLQLKVTF